MQKYFFLFGNTPKLSLLELQSVVGDGELELVLPNVARLSLEDDKEAIKVFDLLGGSVKLVKEIDEIPLSDQDNREEATVLTDLVAAFLHHTTTSQKITFGLGIWGSIEENITETKIKKALKKGFNTSSRFVEHNKAGLSASVLLHQSNVHEIILIASEDKQNEVTLGETLRVQDIDDWTNRDRRKPYADRKKGMLPPKVARMMVNIARGEQGQVEGIKIYDPFCGTGTVLSEAMMVGCDALGSDVDGRATAGAEKNLGWLQEEYGLEYEFKIFYSDATQVAKMHDFSGKKVKALVTEPFLGKPKPELRQLDNIYKGLERLYLGAFKEWTKVLADGASVVIVFPMTQTHRKTYDLSRLIDKIALLGYTTALEPLLYARQGAMTQRQIYVFKFNK